MTGYDSKYTGPSWQQIMASGLDGGDIQAPIDDPIGRPGYWSGALRSQGVGEEDDGDLCETLYNQQYVQLFQH